MALAGEEDDGCVASHRYPVFRGKPDLVESAYLLSFFRTGWGQLLLDHHSRGAAGRNRPLNATSLMKERVPVPPLPVQEQIGALVRQEYRFQLTGNRIPDAYHAALAVEHGCEWVTLDRGFSAYPGLRLINLLDD